DERIGRRLRCDDDHAFTLREGARELLTQDVGELGGFGVAELVELADAALALLGLVHLGQEAADGVDVVLLSLDDDDVAIGRAEDRNAGFGLAGRARAVLEESLEALRDTLGLGELELDGLDDLVGESCGLIEGGELLLSLVEAVLTADEHDRAGGLVADGA